MKSMKQLRDYQIDIANRAVAILKGKQIVYISMEVRTGKTLTSLEIAKLYGAKRVLFLTKKKALSSIEKDYYDFGYVDHFQLSLTNDESMHKLENTDYDLVIHDEHHRFGAFPKPGLATKTYKHMFGSKPMIFLSGTMSPESFSQVYHQFWVSHYSPFKEYKSFYRWADDYVFKFQKKINGFMVNDYSKGNEDRIMSAIAPYVITFTQEQAGFSTEIEEEILYVDMSAMTKAIVKKLEKDLVVDGNFKTILADTPVKLMQKLHQLWSGTVKFENGDSMVIDSSKAEFIKAKFSDSKIGIFYKFKEELNALKQVFGTENLTTDVDDFDNKGYQVIALQIVSGREGISLKNADYLVFYNIDFSATSYWQARDRLSFLGRLTNKIYWIFSSGGIEEKIYKAVKAKKKYTVNIFKKDYDTER
jgi:hypothetical protein